MKNRVKAILLAAGLTLSMLSSSAVFAQETSTETLQEAGTEAGAAGSEAAGGSEDGAYAQIYEQIKAAVPTMLQQLSAMTDEQLESLTSSGSAANASIAANWMGVKEELGSFIECTDQTVSQEGNTITVKSTAKYDGVNDKTVVTVDYVYDMAQGTSSLSWDIQYPTSTLLEQAGLNTLMGLGIVFIVLVFLSFLIRQIHWIPDLVNRKEREREAAVQAAPAPAAAEQAPEIKEQETAADDGELIAVIAAAIAASENTSTDGFVVRSIRKVNRTSRKNWLNA